MHMPIIGFSVIIPLYNKSLYIAKAINSVLLQDYHNYEIIVIDDGSTDNGLEIVKGIIDSRIRIISQNNSGVSKARNYGINQATKEYIAFLDADDWWESEYLSTMAISIMKYPDAGVYSSSYYIVKNNKRNASTVGVESSFASGKIDYYKVYAKTLCMPVWTGATVVSRRILGKYGGFDSNLTLGEDFDLWLRISLEHPVYFINKSLSNYNQDVDQVNRAIGKLHEPSKHILWNLDKFDDYCKKNVDLKKLLDRLRIYGLYPYYLNENYTSYASNELKKVDWTKQETFYKILYSLPILLLRKFQVLRFVLSSFKSYIQSL